MKSISDYLPLQEPTFFILLCLSSGTKHGYAVLKEVPELSQGRVWLSTGTLYGALSRLLDDGLIERVELDTEERSPGKAKKAYRLTQGGAQVLEAELSRMALLLNVAGHRYGEGNA